MCRILDAKNSARYARVTLVFLLVGFVVVSDVAGQVPGPDKKEIFLEDRKEAEEAREGSIKSATKPDQFPSSNLDFQAPKIEFHRESNQISGKGGIVVSEGGVQVQADEGTFHTETRRGQVSGNVVMTTPDGVFSADSADLVIPSETGDFDNAEFTLEQGNYSVRASKARKISEFEFELQKSDLTTCHCLDGDRPWEISSSSCNITQEGYAHSYGTTFRFEGLPILYAPYFVFPVKTERASGLLVPEYGFSSRDGFKYKQPLFLVVDDSTDLTLTPFIETRTRAGSSLQYRESFSTDSTIESRFYYSNESRRGSDLRGLDIAGYSDPTIDTNRSGGYVLARWRPEQKADLPIEFLADGHWTSDNLFVKEIDDEDIGERESQYLTSTAVVRGLLFDQVTAEARTEYNQMLLTEQDVQFHRLPEFSVGTSETFRPFGFNPYGVKLVTGGAVTATDFIRDDGYEGWRTSIRPRASIPFHFQNYVRGQTSVELNQTQYNLRETLSPDEAQELESSESRTVPIFGSGISTGVERVYDLERGNWLSSLVTLGADNAGQELVRLKHTIEPTVGYSYVPDVEQGELPYFGDSLDRIRHRSLVSYGVTSRLYGRMLAPYERSRDIGELAASPETLPTFDMSSAVLDFGRNLVLTPPKNVPGRQGDIRELVTMSVKQTYDYIEDTKDVDPSLGAFSDVAVGMALRPSNYFAFGLGADVRPDEKTFSRYDLGVGIRDDRDDALRLRYSYIDDAASQVEGNIEVKIFERLRAGYYALYDEQETGVVESKGLLRFMNSCKCWSVDLGIRDQSNPDKQQVLLTFTFAGLGDITQDIGLAGEEDQ